MDDLLEDTAQELWSMDQHERLQTEALPVADTHSLESMLQRMEEIEVRFSVLVGLISVNSLFMSVHYNMCKYLHS